MITFGSLFSGVGGFDLGFERAGMTCAFQVEIDKSCQGVLNHHWPDVQKFEDVKNVGKHNLPAVDLICGGFPCQDVSVAGKRAGLVGERSGLWFEFHRIIGELRPQWVVIENVPGLLSSNSGRDFAVILHGLAEFGYLSAWRVLDAQYFGVAQRRRRVFIVASLGDGRAAEVLFESESLPGDTVPGREAGQTAPTLFASGAGTERVASAGSESEFCIPFVANSITTRAGSRREPGSDTFIASDARNSAVNADVSGTLQSKENGEYSLNYQPLCFTPRASSSRGFPVGDLSPTLESANNGAPAIAFTERTRRGGRNLETQDELAYALTNPGGGGRAHSRSIAGDFGVRRLTPTECERLQGFPDGWTDGQSDSVRYRQMGNAVCVPVAEWIGRRILEFMAVKA